MRPHSLLHSQGPRSSIAFSIRPGDSLAEGDTLDFSALLSTALGNGEPVGNLVRVLVRNPSGTAAILQIDPDGTMNGMNWTTIARLDSVHTGDGVRVILDSSQPAGVTLIAPELVPTKNFDGDVHGDILWQTAMACPRHG